jgi:hypothetical protein
MPREADVTPRALTSAPARRLIVLAMKRRTVALLVALGCSTSRVATADPDPPPVAHKLAAPVLQEIMLSQGARFRGCYEEGRRRDAKLHGRVVTRFVIVADGTVKETEDHGSNLPDAAVIACVGAAIKELKFPEPEGGQLAVVYPINFELPTPQQPTRARSPDPDEVPMRYEPNAPDVWLLRIDRQPVVVHEYEFRSVTYFESNGPEAHYPILCQGPCRDTLPLGTYELGLSKDGGTPVSAGVHRIVGPSTLRATYTQHDELRILGLFGGIVGFAGGMILVVVSSDGTTIDEAGVGVGLAVSLVSGAVGIGLALQHDVARIDVVPLDVVPLVPLARAPNEVPVAAGAGPQGAALRVRF